MTEGMPGKDPFPTRQEVSQKTQELMDKIKKDREGNQQSQSKTSSDFPAQARPDEQVGVKGALLDD